MKKLGKGGSGSEIDGRDGPTIAKERLLKRLGWRVITFSYLQDREREAMAQAERKAMWAQLLGPFGIAPQQGSGRKS